MTGAVPRRPGVICARWSVRFGKFEAGGLAERFNLHGRQTGMRWQSLRPRIGATSWVVGQRDVVEWKERSLWRQALGHTFQRSSKPPICTFPILLSLDSLPVSDRRPVVYQVIH